MPTMRRMTTVGVQLLFLLAQFFLITVAEHETPSLSPFLTEDSSAPWAPFCLTGRPFSGSPSQSTEIQLPLKIAFIADLDFRPKGIGLGVLKVIADFGADVSIIAGDLDYLSLDQQPDWRRDYPRKFIEAIDSVLGPDHPIYASFGNHEIDSDVAWKSHPSWPRDETYADVLLKRLIRQGLDRECIGHVGGDMACSFHMKDLLILSSGVDESWNLMKRRGDHEAALRGAMSTFKKHARWRICSWHAPARALNTGEMPRHAGDDPGYEVYRICQQAGGIVGNGHEHQFTRSKSLSSIPDSGAIIAHTAPWWYGATSTRPELVVLGPESGLVFTNGLGGQDMRGLAPGRRIETWWSQVRVSRPGEWHRNDPAQSGALLCEFGRAPDGALTIEQFVALYELPTDIAQGITDLRAQSGRCTFRTVTGKIFDQFSLLNVNEVEQTKVESSSESVAPAAAVVVEDIATTTVAEAVVSSSLPSHIPRVSTLALPKMSPIAESIDADAVVKSLWIIWCCLFLTLPLGWLWWKKWQKSRQLRLEWEHHAV